MPDWTAIILTGGASARMGRDKARLVVAGVRLRERVVACVPDDVEVVIVGPSDPLTAPRATPVRFARESPSGSGPLAAIAAGIVWATTDVVVVLAVDMPFLGGLPTRLADGLRARSDLDALLAADLTGRPQPLCAAYRRAALAAAFARLGDPSDRPVRDLLCHLDVTLLPTAGASGEGAASVDPASDVDTPADLRRARAWLAAQSMEDRVMLENWVETLAAELGVDGDIDVDVLLDIAKDAARGVQRPAAPVTTYLVGLAVAGGMPLADAAAAVSRLAAAYDGGES